MSLGDSLTKQALTEGGRYGVTPTASGGLRLAVTLNCGSIQHFERPADGGADDWTATDLESQGGGCAFHEPITPEWGRGLELLAAK
ncbi:MULTISPECIES: hypothetical protein [unclassified Streptomyces]|uniref:hypothetical protein n=1 Tax=unclassified Streptomyces TaxID=2593676 RepID=UPI00226EB9DC|nr:MULTISPECIES: hypothetical protein [unclassified Streptomyces]MCY0923516.1 hypothetical protein [Streptomyces sp. H27-G5]MCY0961640.1 hypothetical protein [Streptomyces sp. H27-H5]